MNIQLIFIGVLTLTATAQAAMMSSIGDSATANANQTIVSRLQIQKISDLNFGEASPGDAAKTIAPGNSENRENASFEVVGEPQRVFQIVLPARNSVKMISGFGGPNREILIQEFASTPSQIGVLDRRGTSTVFVGATRQGISNSQRPGEYSGQFSITVVY